MEHIPLIIGFASASCLGAASLLRFPSMRYTRNGAMRFLRIGRLQVSWCMCKHILTRKGSV